MNIEQAQLYPRKTCPLCGKVAVLLLRRKYNEEELLEYLTKRLSGRVSPNIFKDVQYEIMHCALCDFYFQTYIPNDALAQFIYTDSEQSLCDGIYKKENRSLSTMIQYARGLEFIGQLINKTPHDIKVLEFGSGWGHWLAFARDYGFDAHGLEISLERIAHAKTTYGLHVVNTTSQLDCKSFDFIFADQVFEHLNEPVANLKTLTSLLTDKGILYISVPNGKDLSKKLLNNQILKAIHPIEHINCFTNASLKKLASLAGLQPLSLALVARKLLSLIRLKRNAHYSQEVLRFWNNQHSSTHIYFIKSTTLQ